MSLTTPVVANTFQPTILAADDTPTNRKLLEAFLGRLGYKVILARDGGEAVQRFEEHRPDIILMDVMMPVLDGYEAAARIKALSADRWVPIVFLSALTNDEQMVAGLEAGGDDYLTKPINFVLLKAKLRSLVRTLQTQRKLDATRKQMAAISENISDAVVVAGTDGIIRWASKSSQATFGFTVGEMVGHSITLLMPQSDAEAHDRHVARYLRGGVALVVGRGPRELVGRHKSGAIFPLEISLNEMVVEGERVYVAVMRDISERKRTEQRLRSDAERLNLYYNEQERERELSQHVVHKVMEHPGLQEQGIRFWVQPANHFSGDVVASSRRADGKLFVMLADATGHGLAAAMSALPLLTLFYGAMYGSRDLSFVVFHMNRMMRSLLPVGRFVAASLVAADEINGTAEVWQAGMPEGVLLGADGQVRQRLPSTQLPLGVMDFSEQEAASQMTRVAWQPGDEFIFVSDGAVEVKNRAGDEFGFEQITAVAAACDTATRFEKVRDALQRHCQGIVQHDDISVMMIAPQRRPVVNPDDSSDYLI